MILLASAAVALPDMSGWPCLEGACFHPRIADVGGTDTDRLPIAWEPGIGLLGWLWGNACGAAMLLLAMMPLFFRQETGATAGGTDNERLSGWELEIGLLGRLIGKADCGTVLLPGALCGDAAVGT